MVQGKMYHLTACPTYQKTPPMSYHKMFRQRLQLRSAEGKQRKQKYSPPEIHLMVVFLHEVLKQRRNMDTFGGIVSKTSSTLPLEMLSTMKYSTVKIL